MDNTTQSSSGGSNFSGVAAAILILTVGIFGGIYLGGNATSQKAATVDAIMQKSAAAQPKNTVKNSISYGILSNSTLVKNPLYIAVSKGGVVVKTSINNKYVLSNPEFIKGVAAILGPNTHQPSGDQLARASAYLSQVLSTGTVGNPVETITCETTVDCDADGWGGVATESCTESESGYVSVTEYEFQGACID